MPNLRAAPRIESQGAGLGQSRLGGRGIPTKVCTTEGTESHRVQNFRHLLRSLCSSVPSVVNPMGAGFESGNQEPLHTTNSHKLLEF
jgi:hypothetical protein